MKHRKKNLIPIMLFLFFIVSTSALKAELSDISGDWNGKWYGSWGGSGDSEFNFIQNGNEITGTAHQKYSYLSADYTLSGEISEDGSITFTETLTSSSGSMLGWHWCSPLLYTGTLSDYDQTISGTYGYEDSGCDGTFTIQKDTQIPIINPPTLISPETSSESNEIINTNTPNFKWNNVQNADSYAIYISQYPYGEENIVFNSENDYGSIYGTEFTLPNDIINYGIKYRWNMRAKKGNDWSDFSEKLYFSTETSLKDYIKGIDVYRGQGIIDWSLVSKDESDYKFAFIKATGGNTHNVILSLRFEDKGVIIDNTDNGIIADGYHWWYVRFNLDYGEYTGWCAGELLSHEDLTKTEFSIGDSVLVNTNSLYLRNSPEKIEAIDGLNDDYFLRNMELALEEGFLVGPYHFAWPNILSDNEDEIKNDAIEEANHFINVAGKYMTNSNIKPALDVEYLGLGYDTGWGYDSVKKRYDEQAISSILYNNKESIRESLYIWINEWIITLEKKGITPIIYSNGDFARNYFDERLNIYDLWFANPTCDLEGIPSKPDLGIWDKKDWKFLQYCWKGSVDGINGDVDLNIFNGDLQSLREDMIVNNNIQNINDSETPGFEILIMFTSIALILLWRNRKKIK